MQTCTLLATSVSYFSKELQNSDPDLAGEEKPSTMNKEQWKENLLDRYKYRDSTANRPTREERLGKMLEVIDKYEVHFSRHLQILLDALNHYAATETVVLLGLCARLSTANQGTKYSGLKTDEDGVQV
jgi:gamma-tubulin complex component 2